MVQIILKIRFIIGYIVFIVYRMLSNEPLMTHSHLVKVEVASLTLYVTNIFLFSEKTKFRLSPVVYKHYKKKQTCNYTCSNVLSTLS